MPPQACGLKCSFHDFLMHLLGHHIDGVALMTSGVGDFVSTRVRKPQGCSLAS